MRNELKGNGIKHESIAVDAATFIIKAENLGVCVCVCVWVYVDNKLSMESHVSHICKLSKCIFNCYNI